MYDLKDLHAVLHDLEGRHTPNLTNVRDRLNYEISRPQSRRLTRYVLPLAAAASVIAVAAISAVVVSGHDAHGAKKSA